MTRSDADHPRPDPGQGDVPAPDDDRSGTGAVGYSRPPKHAQFQRGRSGNPRGRPRRELTVADMIKAELGEKIAVRIGGVSKTMTRLQARALQSAQRADRHDLKLLVQLAGLAGATPAADADEAPAASPGTGVIHLPMRVRHAYPKWEDLFDAEGRPRRPQKGPPGR